MICNDEWNKFMNKPLYCNPVDYGGIVYNTGNDKKVVGDYYEIQHNKDLVRMPSTESKIRSYKLNTGDIIAVAEKRIFDVFLNAYSVFRPVKREKHIVWYKPSTWFRWYWVLEVVNGKM